MPGRGQADTQPRALDERGVLIDRRRAIARSDGVDMFALHWIDIGNERWTTSGFLTRLSNGGPPQVPGTHAGTRGAGEFDGIIAAVKEDEAYYHRDQCDMITMILRRAAEPAWRYGRGRQTTPAADRNRRIGGCGTRVIDQACPWERVLYCYFSAPGVLCHFEKAHPSAHGVCYYRATRTKNKKVGSMVHST